MIDPIGSAVIIIVILMNHILIHCTV